MPDRSQIFPTLCAVVPEEVHNQIQPIRHSSRCPSYQGSGNQRRHSLPPCLYDRAAVISVIHYVKDQFIYHLVIYDVPFGRAGRRARIFIYDALLAVISHRPIGFKLFVNMVG